MSLYLLDGVRILILFSLLSPTPPFYVVGQRLYLAGMLTTISLVMPFAPSYWIIKSIGLTLGVGFFGAPLFAFTEDLLNRTIPNWKEQLDMQKYKSPLQYHDPC